MGLLAVLFSMTWFSAASHDSRPQTGAVRPAVATWSGWSSLGAIDVLILAVCAFGLIVVGLSVARRSPALPMAVTVVLAPLAVVEVLALALRVLVIRPTATMNGDQVMRVMQSAAGAYLGLAFSIALAMGVYATLRREGGAPADMSLVVETIDVTKAPSASRA